MADPESMLPERLDAAFALMHGVDPPTYSQFRVACLMVLASGEGML
jgi:hypothetical protein